MKFAMLFINFPQLYKHFDMSRACRKPYKNCDMSQACRQVVTYPARRRGPERWTLAPQVRCGSPGHCTDSGCS